MPILNGLSFDIEDWFQVENLKEAIDRDRWEYCDLRVIEATSRILRVLENHSTKATFFILGWVAEQCPKLVRDIASLGHEIASHGYGHELVYSLSRKEFYHDVQKSKDILESLTGAEIHGYRAPSFSITDESDWAIGILKDIGFLYDSSIFPTHFHNRYGFNGSSRYPFQFENGLIEMPLSTVRLFGKNIPAAGGGYFRLYPYAYFRYLCRRINDENQPVIFYLHPWELDPGQPRVKISLHYRIRHYVNLEKTEKRLNQLLGDFSFVPLRSVAEQYFSKHSSRLASIQEDNS